MKYQSSTLKWLSIETNDNNEIIKDSLNNVLRQLNSPLVNKNISFSDIKAIPNENLQKWIEVALILNQENVLDVTILNKYPLKQINKIKQQSQEKPFWIDITGKDYPLDFVAWDTETTGLDVKKDRIIQISGAKYKDGKLVDKFDTLVNPRRQILPEVTQLTGISTEEALKAPDISEALPKFLEFCQNSILVGQNIVGYDLPLVQNQGESISLSLPNFKIIDTLPLAHMAFPGRKHYNQESLDTDLKLSEIIQDKGYVTKNVLHNALNDSMTTAELYLIERNTIKEN